MMKNVIIGKIIGKNKIKNMNILLNEEDFRNLTKGEIVEKNGVWIALQDIGYIQMIDILEEHYEELLTKYYGFNKDEKN